MNERRIVIVYGIAPAILVEEQAVAKEKVAKDESAYEEKTNGQRQEGPELGTISASI